MLSGPVNVACSEEDLNANDASVKDQLAKSWDYDTLGVKGMEEDFCEEYLTTVRFSGDRYEVSLPFKKQHPIIPGNYSLARNRVVSLLKRFKSSESKSLNQYDNVIKEQLDSGVVEVIDKHVEEVVPGTVHYIPHKEVLKEDRATTKLRAVYDASAKSYSEPSLNDCILSGPALTPLLFDILLRFPLPKIALIGDLEKALLNVEVKPEDRNLLRFLWIDDVNSLNAEIIKLRFTRLVFGLSVLQSF